MTLFREPLPKERLTAGIGSPGPVDRVLRDFFQQELPQPWPTWKPPVRELATKPKPQRKLARNYLALAASVVFLIVLTGAASQLLRGPVHAPASSPNGLIPGTESAEKPGQDGSRIRPGQKISTPPKPIQPRTLEKELKNPLSMDLPRLR
jgi:hypothetical protein